MKADLQTQLNPEQCWRIYSRLEEMSLKLAKTVGIEERELERYYVPLCQNDEDPGNLKRAIYPQAITKKTAMRQFVRSLQNSGRKSRLIGLDKALEEELGSKALNDYNPDEIAGKTFERLKEDIAETVVDYRNNRAGSNKSSKNKLNATNISKKEMFQEYVRGIACAATFLVANNGSGLKSVNKAIELSYYDLWDYEMNEIPNDIRISIKDICKAINKTSDGNSAGLGPALVRDFLKECGCVWLAKPDVHAIEIFKRLKILDKNKDTAYYGSVKGADQFTEKIFNFARSLRANSTMNHSSITPYKLDKLVWLLCTGNFYLHEKKTDIHDLISVNLLG
ncbi:hypothetical protein [Thermophilibacter provencensis]|uniref:Uncharacterized protein n=1 Tax=Thermophilibacter provencensis TaxID=1852386 RepID=A0ABT7V0S4_9ACTN|nr:hypothetical protein [Thermophilibacter provencensis]MDM8270209.1 hypothetical protein [Thermophilibacter provencensis]